MNSWLRIKFKIKWDRSKPADFSLDLIILDLLIIPAIKNFGLNSGVWTLHRSAPLNDLDGHMIKFAFYKDKKSADDIINFIKANPDYYRIHKNYLEDFQVEDLGSDFAVIAGGINASPQILQVWPYFMKGTCEMFINLFEETKKRIDVNKSMLSDGDYKKIHEDLVSQFKSGGQHAYFHFVWAIFGYPTPLPLHLQFIVFGI